jgi:hypothetical protein
VISADEYRRRKSRDREVLGIEDSSDEDIAAIEVSRPPEAARRLITNLVNRP